MTIRQLWRRITTTRHARALETEIARERANNDRLRAENRALLNSILGIAGVPPLPASLDDLASVQNQSGWLPPATISANRETPRAVGTRHDVPSSDSSRAAARPSSPTAGASGRPQLVTPMRRRSWPQINRMLEFESAKKDKQAADELTNTRS